MQEDRLKVQSLLGVNMVVEAGAGTGKTTSLIDRICLALVALAVPAEKLVALTFTEKAAADIKTRLIAKLQSLIACVHQPEKEDKTFLRLRKQFDIPAADIEQRAEQALARLDLSYIDTIHGFCGDVLRAFPLEAGLSPNVQIDSGARTKRLFEAQWNTFLDAELGPQAPRAAEWKKVLQVISLADVRGLAFQLCSGRIEDYEYASHAEMLAKICQEKSARAQELADYFMQGLKKPRKAENMLLLAASQLKRSALYLQGKTYGPAPEEELDFPDQAVKGWDEESWEEASGIVDFAQKVQPEKQEIFRTALSLVQELVAQVRHSAQEEGILTFDDLIIKTRNLLQQNKSVRQQLKAEFDVLFIDEFQDTDPVQGELLLFLAEAKNSLADRWQDVRLEKGKLFVVGDPKQSIYRFRGADITAYELFTDLILAQGGEKCFLQKNFRSEVEIIDAANCVCERAMVQSASFQPAYVPIFTDRTDRFGAVELAVADPGETNALADDLRHNQAQFIAQWIKERVGRLKLAGGKTLSYGDIALLSRAGTSQEFYLNALRRAGIKFNVEEDKNFYHNQEINDFLNLLRTLEDPEDRISLTGVLRGPLGSFSDEEIYQFSTRGELSIFAKPQDERLQQLYQKLRSFAARAGKLPLKQFLEAVRLETFLPELCALAYDGERSLSNLERLCTMAYGYAQETPTTLGQFLAQVQRLMEEEPERLKDSLSTQTADAVSVMTVHKSKGLEFPVVILTDVSRKESNAPGRRAGHIYSWQYNMHGIRAGKVCDANLAFLEEQQKKHDRCEEIRVLYVALTRAQERLLIVGSLGDIKKTAAAVFSEAGLYPQEAQPQKPELECAQLKVPVHYIAYRDPKEFIYLFAQPEETAPEQMQITAWRTARSLRETRYALACRSAGGKVTASTAVEHPSQAQARALKLGSLVHKTLELYAADPQRRFAAALERAAVLTEAEKALQEEAGELLEKFVHSSAFAPFLKAQWVGSEIPFAFIDEKGDLVSGEIDALVRTPQGLWIADYKTDHVEGNLTAAARKYYPQLEVYRQAVQRLFPGEEVRCSLFFIRAFAGIDL